MSASRQKTETDNRLPSLQAPAAPDGSPPLGYRRHVRAVPAGTWSPETVIDAFRAWSRETGRPPTTDDWASRPRNGAARNGSPRRLTSRQSARWPSVTTVRRYFGSWSAALAAAGFRPTQLAPWELTLAQRVATAVELANEGRSVAQIATAIGVSARTVSVYLHARICPDCGGPLVSPNAQRCHDCDARARSTHWTPDELLQAERARARDRAAVLRALRRIGATTGRRPVWSDLHPKRSGTPSYHTAVSLFGSFTAALGAAGFYPRGRTWTRAEVIAALRAWERLHGRVPRCTDWRLTTEDHPGSRAVGELFGSWTNALQAADLRRDWRAADIAEAIDEWTLAHGRPPTSRDWQTPDPLARRPTTQQVRTIFGSWTAARAASANRPARRLTPPRRAVAA